MSDTGRPEQPAGGFRQPPDGAGPLPERDDTEGHSLDRQFPTPPAARPGPGEQLLRGDGTPADFLDERDTEGHHVGAPTPAPDGRRMGPGEQLLRGDGTPADFIDDADTEGHVGLGRTGGGE